MKRPNSKLDVILYNIPLIGIIGFISLYFYASTLYPGGSQADLNSEGFSWTHNYWCNLLNEKAMNGQINLAKPFAQMAMLILCISFVVFFYQFAKFYASNRIWKKLIQINGFLSMFFALLIATSFHDFMTILSSIFGVIVLIGILKGVYSNMQVIYLISGLFCILLLGINNYIYYTQNYLQILPLLQKVSMGFVLLWVIAINFNLKKNIQ